MNADEFNAAYPVGTPVLYWPGARRGIGSRSKTRTPAWEMNSKDTVVSVDGYGGGIALTHIEVLPVIPEPTIESIIDDIVALPNENSFPMAFSRASAAHVAPSVLKIVNKYRPTTAKDTAT